MIRQFRREETERPDIRREPPAGRRVDIDAPLGGLEGRGSASHEAGDQAGQNIAGPGGRQARDPGAARPGRTGWPRRSWPPSSRRRTAGGRPPHAPWREGSASTASRERSSSRAISPAWGVRTTRPFASREKISASDGEGRAAASTIMGRKGQASISLWANLRGVLRGAMPGPITTDSAWAASAAAQGAEGRAISSRRVSGTHSMAASGRTAPTSSRPRAADGRIFPGGDALRPDPERAPSRLTR